jgi:Flp pilus assembly protein TadB
LKIVEEDSFPHLLKAFIVITLFAFLLLMVVIKFSDNYGTDTTIIDERIGLATINSTLATTEATAQSWQEQMQGFGEGNVFEKLLDILGFMSVGMFNLATQMMSFVVMPFGIFSNVLINVLGIPAIVVAIINVLIILTIIFGIWSLVKRGV